MYTLFDTDSSFFNISVGGNKNITTDVLELSIVEEVGQLLNGTLMLNDPAWYYASLLRAGTTFNLSWGYKNRNQTMNEILIKIKNPDEVAGIGIRSGIKAIVTLPKFVFGNQGQRTYNCNFFGAEYGEDYKEVKIYNTGTKEEMIKTEMEKLGVKTYRIQFNGMNDDLKKYPVMKNEKSYKFLLRLAKEWRCFFIMNRLPSGNLIGGFCDYTEIGSKTNNLFFSQTSGSAGSKKLFEFGVGATYPNVLGGEITHNIGESGQGDHVTFSIVGGKTVVTRYVSESGQVKAYKLNEAEIKKFAQEREGDYTTIFQNVVSASSMDSQIWENKKVRDFFTPEIISTAPQGAGYSGSLDVIGDPSLCIPMECKFGYGFPPQLQEENSMNRIFIKKVEHSLSGKGYMGKVEVSDALTTYNAYVEGEG